MKRGDLPIRSATMTCSILSLVLFLTVPGRAQSVPDPKCTGEADVPWSEQVAACTSVIESGKYAGNDLAKSFIFRSKAYALSRDLDHSLADIEQAIQLDPNNAFAVGARGDIHLVRKEYDRALADYTKASDLDPANALTLVGRGMVYVATGDIDRAMADFEQAVRVQPASALALYWRGFARRQKGDVAAGEADMATAKKIDPNVDR
jgi:tetratricopeptide (TPR) repeat protein